MNNKDTNKVEAKEQKFANTPESKRELQIQEAALLLHRLSETQLIQILKEISG